jgi:hypothetical protein
MFQRNR